MEFYKHPNIVGKHSILSPSKYHWISYSDDKMIETFRNTLAVQRGTELHEFAATCIKLGQKLPKANRTLNMYVNDAIGYRMRPEQPLYYSENAFGTADSICFNEKDSFLRIHDLKTGQTPASEHQLEVYEALFCLEYDLRPKDIQAELRIYQSNEKLIIEPDPIDIQNIMDKIKRFDLIIAKMRAEVD